MEVPPYHCYNESGCRYISLRVYCRSIPYLISYSRASVSKHTKGVGSMNRSLIAYCGSYCGACEWKEKIGCNGCKASDGNMFWGECKKAKCCISKGYEHCGECPDLPCIELKLLFGDPEHGDKGVRLRNLLNWKSGNNTFERLHNTAQDHAKEL